jgi:MazG family protein
MSEALAGLASLVEKLRRECPWDREQTPETIRTYLLEECYETLEAIDSGDPEALRDELGDLLFQVFFLATLASERRWFDLDEVAATVARKMTDRHPHVFGETKAGSAAEVKKSWETRKRSEAGAAEDPLGSIPASLPAVAAAYRMTSRAADLGFDWERDADVAAKIEEEIEEWREAAARGDREAEEREVGELLLSAVARAAAFRGPGSRPAGTNRRFRSLLAGVARRATSSTADPVRWTFPPRVEEKGRAKKAER